MGQMLYWTIPPMTKIKIPASFRTDSVLKLKGSLINTFFQLAGDNTQAKTTIPISQTQQVLNW